MDRLSPAVGTLLSVIEYAGRICHSLSMISLLLRIYMRKDAKGTNVILCIRKIYIYLKYIYIYIYI
jgi:hypothetical protein